ncbi:MAG: polysaccharide pyruvyl transferase family protein [Lachnospiraceae bacterium]|nr:polysaccharide pyruvyl transferase family protein [Lachnospiraceae bacterium]
MNIVKRAMSVLWNRALFPLYTGTIKAVKDKKRIREKYQIKKGVKNIVIFGTPNHGNLGDYAIYLAESQLFARYLPECNIFGVNMTDFQHEVKTLCGLLKKEDLLVLTGGGNLGNQYMDDEKIRREVILRFPYNRIVLFPQTMYFTEDAKGREEEQKTSVIYGRHRDLWLTARDEKSCREMERIFSKKVRLLPDVVLTWKGMKQEDKKGALLVLRNDVEGVLRAEHRNTLKELLQPLYGMVEETDTVVEVGKDLASLEDRLRKKMEQIGSASLVVTDRLHGMIFAALMQTPCLALHNYNHKVEETYKWIQDLDYVEYVADFKNLPEALDRLKKKNCKYTADEVEKEYDVFMREIISG